GSLKLLGMRRGPVPDGITVQYFLLRVYNPQQADVPAKALTDRLQDIGCSLLERQRLREDLRDGEPGVAAAFRPLAFREITQIGRENRRPLDGNAGDGQLDRKLRSVGPQGRHFDALVEDRPLAGGQMAGQTAAVLRARRWRADKVGRLPADDLLPPVGEGGFVSRVELDDIALVFGG